MKNLNRMIKFRGKGFYDLKWYYGDLAQEGDECFINAQSDTTTSSKVFPITVGQYTDLCDKNGKEICDGDILVYENAKYLVQWNKWAAGFITRPMHEFYWDKAEIIGNIHDNPELVEVIKLPKSELKEKNNDNDL